jgi:hydrogenase-4 component B
MTLVLTSLAILGAGALVPLLLFRVPRVGLGASMLAMFAAAILVLIAAFEVLLGATAGDALVLIWPLPLGTARLALDGLSAWFLMTIGLVAACVAPYSVAYMRPFTGREPVPLFGAILCILLASLILLVCAADAVLFLVGWELMTLAAFFLISFHHDRPEVRRGAWMYLIATHTGTALCVLPLLAALCAAAGTTAFSAFPGATASTSNTTLMALFALAVLGFGTKAGFLPMHVWLPAAHPVAPTPVSALLSGVVVKTGIYGLLRTLTWLPPLPAACGEALLVVGVISGVMGVLYALAQHDLKRLLAYHTVENIGIIAIGIAVGMLGQARNEPAMAALGYAGALLHVTNHAVFKGLLFLSAGAVLHGAGTVEIERLGGLAKKTPVNAVVFLIGAVAICGLPPLNGFVSEWVVYAGLFTGAMHGPGASGGMTALGILSLALMGGLALACFAKVFGTVFLGTPRDADVHVHATPAAMKAAMVVLALACTLIGVLPGLWVPLTYSAAGKLAGIPAEDVGTRMAAVLSPAAKLTAVAALFVGLVAGLIALRRIASFRSVRRFAPQGSPLVATWGCSYAFPTPRMQYTATSFASPLVTSFRGLLWPERDLVPPAGAFPSLSHVETHAPDFAEKDIFQPLFRGIARLFAMVKTVSWTGAVPAARAWAEARHPAGPLKTLLNGMVGALRRGSIQVYLLFIVLTVVVLFLFEGISAPGTAREAMDSVAVGTQ